MSEETNVDLFKVDPCIALLENMLDFAKRGLYSEEIKNEIIEINTCYVTGQREGVDPDTLKYFFTGWWVHQHIGRTEDSNGSSTGTFDSESGTSPNHIIDLHD